MNARTLYLGILAGLLTASCISRNGKQEHVQKEPVPQPPMVTEMPDDTLMTAEKEISGSVSQPVVLTLQPVERDIPSGLPISADSLSMCTEYDYYPIAAKRVKVIITNHTNLQYEGGEEYSLVYYNEEQKKWEPQPTNPIVNSILWIFSPDYPTRQQTIEFYTDKNRAGKYRIYKSFNRDTRTAYAEFELISSEQHQKLLDKINSYYKAHPKAAIIQNLDSWGYN